MNIMRLPVREIRRENYAQAERNRIDSAIRAKESQIATFAHDIWLLRLERTQYEELPNGR